MNAPLNHTHARQRVEIDANTPEWESMRQAYFCASEAPAMLGTKGNAKREALLRLKATGEKEVFDEFTLNLFAKGHEAEDSARAWAGEEVNATFTPAIFTLGNLWASLDGIDSASLDDYQGSAEWIWEHKLINKKLSTYILENGDLPDTHWPQVEHQLHVTGAKGCLFTVSDGTPTKDTVHLMYYPHPDRLARVLAGWETFAQDLALFDSEAERFTVVNDSEALELAEEFEELNRLVNELTKERDAVKDRIKALAGDHETRIGNVEVYAIPRKGVVDNKRIYKDYGIDPEAYRGESTISYGVRVAKGA